MPYIRRMSIFIYVRRSPIVLQSACPAGAGWSRKGENGDLRRLTISVDDELADTFDRLVANKGYENRSEAFRDLLREELDRKRCADR